MDNGYGRTMTVSELNEYARRLLASDPLLRSVEVSGEISGYKHHYSGHRYFMLKDGAARVQCVMFRQDGMSLDFEPADGMRVILRASASIFVRDGSYQLYVTSMRKSGVGDLYLQFEKLKAKLMAEGLFDAARKREIPLYPKKIGLVTSQTGAAIRDMIRVARRRNPHVGILIAPCAVQGASAVPEIVRAIRRLNENGECDVLLVGRGGGSIEDLWAFNEEEVARAIAASRIPIISCVGHEVDFTIADFVADLRAPTPSAAAELAVPVWNELNDSLDALRQRLSQALSHGQQIRRGELRRLCQSPALQNPADVLLKSRRSDLEQRVQQLNRALQQRQDGARRRLELAQGMLRTLDPGSVVERGYAIVMRGDEIVTSTRELSTNDPLTLRFSDGRVHTRVTEIEGREADGQEKTEL